VSRALHANFSSYDLVSGGWFEVKSEGYVSRNTLAREREEKSKTSAEIHEHAPIVFIYRTISRRVCTGNKKRTILFNKIIFYIVCKNDIF